jgi:hypothetical protein
MVRVATKQSTLMGEFIGAVPNGLGLQELKRGAGMRRFIECLKFVLCPQGLT